MTRSFPLGAAFLLAACASTPAPPPRPASAPYNLSGYPAAFREGFALGCDASRKGAPPDHRPPARTPPDPQFRLGWQDGLSACRRKK